mgnify:CR=1 FL=1
MTDKIIFQGSVRAGKTAAIIATLTAERDRLRADLEKVTAEREELIEMIEGLLICIAGKSHAMQEVINRLQEWKK